MKKVLLGLLAVAVIGAVVVRGAGLGWFGRHEAPGSPIETARPAEIQAERAAGITKSGADRQILFGDLHVHTTFSFDAFLTSIPIGGGEGSHPPADACDFARYCSALDFWSINDHAEGITPLHWKETVDSIRQCNEIAGDPANPDVVAYLGWEWTQVGATPEEHYGHKNVVIRDLGDGSIPARPIASGATVRTLRQQPVSPWGMGIFALLAGDSRVSDLALYFQERAEVALCPTAVDTRELPPDCLEYADTPADLFRKLDEWGHESIVIPHGTTWGFYTPPGSSWDKQLTPAMHDPNRQTLLEIYSGHGDSDVYRSWRPLLIDASGNASCPEPSDNYLPTCWRAGEIIRERCKKEGHPDEECERRAVETRANAAAAGHAGHLTVPGATAEEWLDSGQCQDCDEPAFNYRPRGSAQYITALRKPGPDGVPIRFQMGFMSSSDNHYARPGTGYKEKHRRGMTESRRQRATGALAQVFAAPEREPIAESIPFDRESSGLSGFQLFETERQASFFLTGGLIGVHSGGRDRGAIWDAFDRKEVYGTSGPRILLWFELLNAPDGGMPSPMGSALVMSEPPRLRVRAVGSFAQKDGCPDWAEQSLGPERLERICKGECYYPSDQRRLITRIEVIRIRPQNDPSEPVDSLIDDPWRTFACPADPSGCTATFEDPDFLTSARDAVYYARVYEEPAPAINAGNVRCKRDASGACVSVDLCGGEGKEADDCLSGHEPRAWSSPIFVDYSAPPPAPEAHTL
jgi:hypothetical protein